VRTESIIRKGARAVAEPTEMKIGFAETTDFMFEALTDPPVFDDGAFHAQSEAVFGMPPKWPTRPGRALLTS
jgi:hypothetical protein